MSYDRIADVYDLLAALYSAGGIARANAAHLDRLRRGQRVLYAGAGTGAECLAARRRGAEVTALDRSARMLARLERRLIDAKLSANVYAADLFDTTLELGPFDLVVAPFFFNVFSESDVIRASERLLSFLAPGGSLVVADFRAPTRGWFRWLQRAIYLPPLALFWAASLNAWHGLYDYPQLFAEARLPLELEGRQPVRAWGLPLFESVTWKKLG